MFFSTGTYYILGKIIQKPKWLDQFDLLLKLHFDARLELQILEALWQIDFMQIEFNFSMVKLIQLKCRRVLLSLKDLSIGFLSLLVLSGEPSFFRKYLSSAILLSVQVLC